MLNEVNNRYSDLNQGQRSIMQTLKDKEKLLKKADTKIAEFELEIGDLNKRIEELQIESKKLEDSLSE